MQLIVVSRSVNPQGPTSVGTGTTAIARKLAAPSLPRPPLGDPNYIGCAVADFLIMGALAIVMAWVTFSEAVSSGSTDGGSIGFGMIILVIGISCISYPIVALIFLVLLVGDIIFFLGAFLSWIVFSSDLGLAGSVFVPDLVLCVGFFLALLFYGLSYTQARKRHIARQKLPHTVTFSKKGVWESGTFFPLNERYEANLEKVTLTSQPPVLHFYLKKWSWDSDGSGSSARTSLRVLVPHGQEGEAGLLLERFQTEVIAVRKQEEERERQEQERRKNPPEPR